MAVALPLLDCMKPLRAAETARRAKRSVFIYLPNGVNTIDFQITQAGADYAFSKSLKPLEKHRANIMDKVEVREVASLVRWCVQQRLITI